MSNCLFCNLVQLKSPNCLFSDDQLMVLEDINPQAPVHQLIIPKKHIATLNDIAITDHELIGYMFQIAKKQAAKTGISEAGYRTVFNCNAGGGQAIYHIHLHLMGGRSFSWPPG